MGALTMGMEETVRVDPDRCIGCGLCVVTCPTEALRLIPKAGADCRIPPTSMAEQMMLMAKKRRLI
ncbi:hypothetical protein DSCA_01470 [Desulfosarcina alkanivorans]|uniref:4Fe-4S ferredoxin-type domain-containing protein n=1 Tax=Desulfosarcina alkanivorans TaxID=571177 RepID=A0A5K7YNP7_9BACT|nr:4Fe-4S binding protein [Desulfosarcina alkanivorans]BBO66217.1 hypothetical protein DSCA_01470 [Desulfosarcina alkanivorans]